MHDDPWKRKIQRKTVLHMVNPCQLLLRCNSYKSKGLIFLISGVDRSLTTSHVQISKIQ